MKTNAELLLGYGFILPETDAFHNDYHHVKTKSTDDDDLAGIGTEGRLGMGKWGEADLHRQEAEI